MVQGAPTTPELFLVEPRGIRRKKYWNHCQKHSRPPGTNQPTSTFCIFVHRRLGGLYFETVAVGLDFVDRAELSHCCRPPHHRIHRQFDCMSQPIPCARRWALDIHHISPGSRNLDGDQFNGVHQRQDRTMRPGCSMWLGKLADIMVTKFLGATLLHVSVQ